MNPKVKPLNSFILTYLRALSNQRFRGALISVLGAFTVFLALQLRELSFDFEFEKLFPKNDPDTALFLEHTAEFGFDNDFLRIIVSRPEGIFDSLFLRNVRDFEDGLKSITGMSTVYSPLSQQRIFRTPMGLLSVPLMHETPSKFSTDSTYIFSHPFYSQSFGPDAQSLSLFIIHEHFTEKESSEFLIQAIEQLATDSGLTDVKIVGKVVAQTVFIDFIQKDFTKFLIGSILLSFTILFLIFRDVKSALFPFIISLLSLIWLFGMIAALGYRINLLSALLPPIIFFVSMSDVIHLMNHIRLSFSSLCRM